jgi:hypothetical protein
MQERKVYSFDRIITTKENGRADEATKKYVKLYTFVPEHNRADMYSLKQDGMVAILGYFPAPFSFDLDGVCITSNITNEQWEYITTRTEFASGGKTLFFTTAMNSDITCIKEHFASQRDIQIYVYVESDLDKMTDTSFLMKIELHGMLCYPDGVKLAKKA